MNVRGSHHYAFAVLSVFAMFASMAAGLFYMLVGGNPYHADPPRVFNVEGVETTRFHSGDWVIVRRRVCLDRTILAQQSPALYDQQRHAIIALPGASTVSIEGCAERSSMIQIPTNLPAGFYEYRNVSRFQNNLVGRDEFNAYPPKTIEVLP
jgi:hypothetical protein